MKENVESDSKAPSIEFEASIKFSLSDWRISYRLSKGWWIALLAIGIRVAILIISKHS